MIAVIKKSHKFSIKFVLSAVLASCGLTGCGSNSNNPNNGPGSLVITKQPSSESVPLDSAATFTVAAIANGPIAYQWTRNGTAIPGANSTSYSLPLVSATDSGAIFGVKVTSDANNLTSQPAVLTVGPRSPADGDLRFQLVDSPAMSIYLTTPGSIGTGVIIDTFGSFTNGTVSPLGLLSQGTCVDGVQHDCAWDIDLTPLPAGQSGLNALWKGGLYQTVDSDLAQLSTSQTVITSLDLQPADDGYAVTAMQTTQPGGFDMRLEVVPAASVPTTLTSDGASGRVVTAVSFDAGGQANLLSYGWQSDQTTAYDTTSLNVAPEGVSNAAAQLAQQGYIITAFGGDAINGYLLIGTKVHGDTLPRPLSIGSQQAGYAPVILLSFPEQMGYLEVYEQ